VIRVKCLLVDDLAENLVAMSALLRRDDVTVLEARSGTEALNLLLEHDVALALIDVQMPDMDGFELAELMRGSERTRHVPIIFATAGDRDHYRLFKGYESGAVDFLYKPIDPHILRNKADVFFQLHRQRQQLMRELQDRTETLHLNEMFAAVLGHDLRTPPSALVTGAQLLQHQSTDEAVQRIAARMLSSGKRLTRMIEDLLDLTRARLAGGIPITRAPTDLGTLVAKVVQEQQANHPERQIEVTPCGDLTGEWDPERLAQVASNLIGNALVHGEGTAAVRVRLDGTAADAVSLSVANPGTIDPAMMPHLFDPFRGGDRNGRQRGLGLGLYIAQQVIHAHEGTIDVRSTRGEDVVFSVKIPRGAFEITEETERMDFNNGETG